MTRTLSLVAGSLLWASVAFGNSFSLEVDLSERELHAYVDGEIVRSYPVSIGKPEKPTPVGAFVIKKVIFNPAWRPPNEKWARGKTYKAPGHPENPMKVVKMFFREPDYYIHGTDDHESLGDAKSHGCVRMAEADVKELSKMVMEHGGKPKPEPWYRRIFRRKTSQVVYLADAVPIAIRK
ncbi:MAG TPA: L,D-transpeptidase [Thermoanaerobaculia bacterium]